MMWHSIQENWKNINRKITLASIVSLLVSAIFLASFAFFLLSKNLENRENLIYSEGDSGAIPENASPFGAINSPVYTYAWCQGANKIKESNKINFRDADEAEKSGRTLSKLCSR